MTFAAVISVTPTPTRICAKTSSYMSAFLVGGVGDGFCDAVPVTTSMLIVRFVLSRRRTMVSILSYTPDAVTSSRLFVSGQYAGFPFRFAYPGVTWTDMSGSAWAFT